MYKKQRHHLADKCLSSQSYGFPSIHVWMWELDCEESWALKNWCFWSVVLEKTLESPMESTEMKPVNPKGNQSWIFIGRTDDEADIPIFWPPDAKSIHWKRLWCCERLEAGGWDGWIVSLTQWTWVWANSRRYWRTEKPGVLQSMGLQKVGHKWATKQEQSHDNERKRRNKRNPDWKRRIKILSLQMAWYYT